MFNIIKYFYEVGQHYISLVLRLTWYVDKMTVLNA